MSSSHDITLTPQEQALIMRLKSFRVPEMAHILEEQLKDPNADLNTFLERMTAMVDAEWQARADKRFNRLMKEAHLRYPAADLDETIYRPERQLDTQTIERLSTCHWIEEGKNLIVTGSSASGKTYLINAFCVTAMKQSKSVKYIKANTLMSEMEQARIKSTNLDYLNKLTKLDLLVIDDFGLMDLDLDKCRDLFEVLDTRDGRKSTVVVACNTASAFALDAVRDEFDIPIIGVIEPGAKVAAAQTRNKRVGIIGTVGTVGSGIHAEYLKHLDPEITVFGKACPLFVPLVEEGWLHDPVTDEVAARYLKELQDKQVDTLILGCTHYPLLRSTIRKIMGDGVCLVNPAYETALELGRLLEEKGLAGEGTEKNEFPYRFYVSDLADEFKAFANSILPYDVEMTKKIDIEKY